jgi:hypothetical protein
MSDRRVLKPAKILDVVHVADTVNLFGSDLMMIFEYGWHDSRFRKRESNSNEERGSFP